MKVTESSGKGKYQIEVDNNFRQPLRKSELLK